MKNGITILQRNLYENPNKWGKEYNRIDLDRAILVAKAVPRDVKKILDLGSGDGLVFNALKETGHDPVALDISRIALNQIHGKMLVQGTASNLPFLHNSFDLVVACEILEHIPNVSYNSVLNEIKRVTKKYVLITVPYKEKLDMNFARCQICGCIFNGAYHVRSFKKDAVKFLFKKLKCLKINEIVETLNPARTFSLELYLRQHVANEYLYVGASLKCPLCQSSVDRKPNRNWIGWIVSGMRYLYRSLSRKKTPLWYLALYQKVKNEKFSHL